MQMRLSGLCLLLAIGMAASAKALEVNLDNYKAQPGLRATIVNDQLTVEWQGDDNNELRLRFTIEAGTPTIQELAIRPRGAQWRTLMSNVTPEFRVVSGVRRISAQQLSPRSLAALGFEITPEITEAWERSREPGKEFEWLKVAAATGKLTAGVLAKARYEAFWDAPLFVEGSGATDSRGFTVGGFANTVPPRDGLPGQPGLPRKSEEVVRATAEYQVQSCEVKTNGSRLEISFPGVKAGIFAGSLRYDIYKGSNLIRQMLIAKTDHPSAAFKYDGGLKGLPIQETARVVWRDLANRVQDYRFGGLVSQGPATVKSSNRLIAAELAGGAIAVFPPPHSFYWGRESEEILGYSWYRKDSDTQFSFGLRQAEKEEEKEFAHNFALYSARPGTWQRMLVFLYVSPGSGQAALDSALAFTNGDRFRPLPGYKVMGTHTHTSLVSRLRASGGMDNRINDIESLKGAGIDIQGVIDSAGRGSDEEILQGLADYYDAARRHSDKNFLLMPDTEDLSGPSHGQMGGHSDLIVSRPLYWLPKRAPGQPLVQQHPKYGTVYNIGGPEDMMRVTELENALIFMPHPRTKGSTGFPDAIKDTAHFKHENFRGFGYRWGMGIDASETRLGEYRFLTMWDEVNNWLADEPGAPKYSMAIAETLSVARGKPPSDDTYGMSPVNYVKLDHLPTVDDMSPIVNALKRGDYFVTSGEVLIPEYSVKGRGAQLTITAEVEWTFPLEFVEIVWGDGEKVDRQIISTADQIAFGKKRFTIPFNADGKKWMRFAAWDAANNGAMTQPIKLNNGSRSSSTQ